MVSIIDRPIRQYVYGTKLKGRGSTRSHLDRVYHTAGDPGALHRQSLISETFSTVLSLNSQLDDFAKSATEALYHEDAKSTEHNVILKRQHNVLKSRSVYANVSGIVSLLITQQDSPHEDSLASSLLH